MKKHLLFALLGAAASAPRPAQAQATDPLPLRQPELRVVLADTLVLPRALRGGSNVYCPAIIITRTDDVFFPYTTIQTPFSRIAGVQVTPNSGAPGDWGTIRMRGSNLHGSDQPLYVIDGLPALNADFAPLGPPVPYYEFGQAPELSAAGANPLLFVAPQDIESVTLIKDAAGTARYGAQGSNGVVAITTRRGGKAGSAQPLRVRYEGFGGAQQVRQRYELLDARQFAALSNEAWQNSGSPAPQPFPASALAQLGAGTDWQQELFRTAFLQSHFLSLDGSTARTRYGVSANYLSQAGVVQGSTLHRYGLRLHLAHQATPRLALRLSATAALVGRQLPDANAVRLALELSPTIPATDAQGNLTVSNNYPGTGVLPGQPLGLFNPLALARDGYTDDATRRLLVQAGGTYQLGLHTSLELTLSHEQAAVEATVRALGSDPAHLAAPPQVVGTISTTQRLATSTGLLRLAYTLPESDQHQLTAAASLLAQVYDRSHSQLVRPSVLNLPSSFSLPLSALSPAVTGTYTYRQRYTATASLRADRGSTIQFGLGTDDHWALYPGGEVRWHAAEEAFLQGTRFITALDVWLSAGQSSSALLPAATYLSAGPTPPTDNVGLSPASRQTLPRTTQLEAGLHTALASGHLSLDISAYRRTTSQAGIGQGISVATLGPGEYILTLRDATLRNQGLELAAWGYWQLGKLRGTSRLAASLNQQQLISIEDRPSDPVYGLPVGEGLHPFLATQRLDVTATGQLAYRDLNADGRIGFPDYTYQGTGLPTRLLSFGQDLELGRFTLQTQFDGMFGYQLLNTTLARLDLPLGGTNGTTRLLDRWTPTHYSPDIPQTSYFLLNTNEGAYTDRQIQSANHLRLSNLTVSYRLLPADSPHQLSVWVGGQNLFVLTSYRGFDPNVSSGGAVGQLAGYDTNRYPVARVWQAGVRAAF